MTLNGIDVASYQTGMNVGTVAGDFVIVKATGGTGYVNPSCNTHVEQTLNAGKKLGLYHFAHELGYQGSAEAEAQFFLDSIKNYIDKAMLILDYESDNQTDTVWAKRWLDYVYAKTGIRPVLYISLSNENNANWSNLANDNYGLWIAQYNNYDPVYGYQPRELYGSLKHFKSMVMFQYTSNGRLTGWGGNLDFDVFYGDKAAWDKYTSQGSTAPNVNVYYNLRQLNSGWLGEVKNFNNSDDNGFAGNPNHKHDLLSIRVDHGSLKYRVHTIGGSWLPWVYKGDINDTENGCAGIAGQAIDGVQMVYTSPSGETYQQAYYRSQTTERSGWLPVACDDGTSIPGFGSSAGVLGEPLDRLQISINLSNPF
ncbi:GH25 family lysozyme [Latilactobacillus sakei]